MPKEKIATNEEFFQKLINAQEISQKQLDQLDALYEKIEDVLKSGLKGEISTYKGGSIVKGTGLKESFDLNIVVYSTDSNKKPRDFHAEVGRVLRKKWKNSRPKNLGWEIRIKSNFHVDVLPATLTNRDPKYALFYDTVTEGPLETSIEYQDELIRDSNRNLAIKLLKLWKLRRKSTINSFLLENIVVNCCRGIKRDQLEKQLTRIFKHVKDNLKSDSLKITDPANSDNDLSALISTSTKAGLKTSIKETEESKTWNKVFKR